jgi:hypothetical protein
MKQLLAEKTLRENGLKNAGTYDWGVIAKKYREVNECD